MKIGCLPQKAELVYIIPTIRRELAKELNKNMSESKIATKLGLTKAAISQYINKKRGTEINLPTDLKKEIKNSAEKIGSNKSTSMQEIAYLLKLSKETKFTCKICKESNCH